MARIIGLGGVFIQSADPVALREWYQDLLEIDVREWGAIFPFSNGEKGYNVWSVMKMGSPYFAPSSSSFMMNFRVDDLSAFLLKIREKGIEPVTDPETSEFGKFAWILDPDGNKIELWEPALDQ